jgi:7-cyano-7-deazaguanine synthase
MGQRQNTLVLFSGGMDSTIALYERLDVARVEGGQVHCLTFTYGQRHVNAECHAAKRIVGHVRASTLFRRHIGQHVVAPIALPRTLRSSIMGQMLPVDKYKDVAEAEERGHHDSAFVPYRNLIMLTIAAAYARELECGNITTGLRGGFPDCTAAFERQVQDLLIVACPSWPLRISTPTHMSRESCLSLASIIPECLPALALTHTCFEGNEVPCGHCLPCLKRAEGFARAGLIDPIFEFVARGGKTIKRGGRSGTGDPPAH